MKGYKYYVWKNQKPDTKETYREYCEQVMPMSWQNSPEGMKQQFVDVNFKFRYIINLE